MKGLAIGGGFEKVSKGNMTKSPNVVFFRTPDIVERGLQALQGAEQP
jgi:hypothetical protein